MLNCTALRHSRHFSLSLVFILLSALFISTLYGADAQEVGAGHFRYATMFWSKTDDDMSNTVHITIQSAWRRSFSSSYFTEAAHPSGDTVMKINGKDTPIVDFGDDTHAFLQDVRIIAWSEAEDWFLGEQVYSKTYDTPNNRGQPWDVKFTGCCRIAGVGHAGDDSWELHTDVDLLKAVKSARIVSLPVTFTRVSTISDTTFQLMTSDDMRGINPMLWTLGGAPGYTPPTGLTLDERGGVVTLTRTPAAPVGLLHLLAHARDEVTGLRVPIDMIVNVTATTTPRPEWKGSTVTLLRTPVVARVGFKVEASIEGFQAEGATSHVGFTVGRMPKGAMLSTVHGLGSSSADAAVMTFQWTPCPDQLGATVVCMDVVNAEGIASTQRCLSMLVQQDEAPSLSVSYNGQHLPHNGATDMLYIGKHYSFPLVALDSNTHDTVDIAAVGDMPPGAMLSEPETAVVIDNGREMAQTTRMLSFSPKHDTGGYSVLHCFTATDSCGETGAEYAATCAEGTVGIDGMGGGVTCAGHADTTTHCVTFRVKRCEFVVRAGQELQNIAAVYRTDWLQLWSHNQHILHPDLELHPGSTIHIGHSYYVQPYDTPADVAARFGMDAHSFHTLNADVMQADMGASACDTIHDCQEKGQNGETYQWCVLPNSCEGQSGSIYQQAFADQGWFASAKDGAP